MTWRDQPIIKGQRSLQSEERAKRFSNPPSSPGLCGLQLDKSPYERSGYARDGVVGTSSTMSVKGPFK